MAQELSRFSLSGWKAIAVIPLVVAWYAVSMWYHIRPVDDAGRQAVQAWLLHSYREESVGEILRKLQAARDAGSAVEPETAPMDVQIVSASAHGGTANMIMKVELTVNGGPPPDGRSIRYLRVCRNLDGTWNVFSESTSDSYSRALWYNPY